MPATVLRLYDGFADTSPQLRDDVRDLQARLHRSDRGVVIDGFFGPGTECAVRGFQGAKGLRTDGAVGIETWTALCEGRQPGSGDQVATTFRLDDPDLVDELVAAARYGAQIDAVAGESGLPPSVIAGLGSRQSRWGLALEPRGAAGSTDWSPRPFAQPWRDEPLPPDGEGFARGVLGIDYDSCGFARTGDWCDPAANIRQGCLLVTDAKAILRRRTILHGRALLRAALAAYNCGLDNVLHALRQGYDLDFYTSGRDYSRDVVNRAGFFQAHGWE